MNDTRQNMAPMSRITLEMRWRAPRRETDVSADPLVFDFIYGIGVAGLSDFEMLLMDRKTGDRLTFEVKRDQISAFFGYAFLPFPPFPKHMEMVRFQADIRSVAQAEPREVVSALAANAEGCGGHHHSETCGDDDSCGSRGGCSCGCGGAKKFPLPRKP